MRARKTTATDAEAAPTVAAAWFAVTIPERRTPSVTVQGSAGGTAAAGTVTYTVK
jgi:hypothetical protein